MDEKKIIAVVGATGAQGGGVCRAILKDVGGGYRVRALTRNAGSDKAKELKKLGAEVVEVDIDDAESLKRAIPRRPRGVLRHLLLGALFSREGTGGGEKHGRRGETRRRAARHLVDA